MDALAAKISVIVPCYNEQEAIPFFYDEIVVIGKKMKEFLFEIIFINDGSTDGTLTLIKEWEQRDSRFKVVDKKR